MEPEDIQAEQNFCTHGLVGCQQCSTGPPGPARGVMLPPAGILPLKLWQSGDDVSGQYGWLEVRKPDNAPWPGMRCAVLTTPGHNLRIAHVHIPAVVAALLKLYEEVTYGEDEKRSGNSTGPDSQGGGM